jgi:predicted transglutaminase-like cysteine proteinase
VVTSKLQQIAMAQGDDSFLMRAPAILKTDAHLMQGKEYTSALLEPTVFGATPLRVSHTAKDAQWLRVRNASTSDRLKSPHTQALRVLDNRTKLEQVNLWVNTNIAYQPEDVRGPADKWATPVETLRSRKGDCEDIAILKMQLLTTAGFERDHLYLTILQDQVTRSAHAVLIAKLEGAWVILDNRTLELVDAEEASGYRPVLSFGFATTWAYGYQHKPSPNIRTAAVEVASAWKLPTAPAATLYAASALP